jgi:hypothetical protein
MNEAEAKAWSTVNRARVMKRWAKAGRKEQYEAGRRMTEARRQNRVTLPRMQDTRTAQVLGKTSCSDDAPPTPPIAQSCSPETEARPMGIWERVDQRMAEQGPGAPTDYWGRHLLKTSWHWNCTPRITKPPARPKRRFRYRWCYSSTRRKSI